MMDRLIKQFITPKEGHVAFLIQRCASHYHPSSFAKHKFEEARKDKRVPTVYDLLSFDYMGSSEFEFGTVPGAIRQIQESVDKKGHQDIIEVEGLKTLKGEQVYVLCNLNHADLEMSSETAASALLALVEELDKGSDSIMFDDTYWVTANEKWNGARVAKRDWEEIHRLTRDLPNLPNYLRSYDLFSLLS